MTWVIGLILVAGVVFVALAATSRDGADDGVAQTSAAETTGDALPTLPLDGEDPAFGTAAPSISAQTLDGAQVTLEADGTARVYGFFAHWCPHCQAELPRTAEWLNTNTLPSGVEVVAISTAVDSSRDNYPPSAWFEEEAWPATVLLDSEDSTIAQGFGLTGFPFWVAVDSDGNVVGRISGEIDIPRFEELIAAAQAGA